MKSEFDPPRKKYRPVPPPLEGPRRWLGHMFPPELVEMILSFLRETGRLIVNIPLAFLPGVYLITRHRYLYGLLTLFTFAALLTLAIYRSVHYGTEFFFYLVFFLHTIAMYLALYGLVYRNRPRLRRMPRILILVITVAVVSLFFGQVQASISRSTMIYVIRNREYRPTFETGDRILIRPNMVAKKAEIRPERRDIVLFSTVAEGARWVGRHRPMEVTRRVYSTLERVVAVGGDIVVIRKDHLMVNNHELTEDELPLVKFSVKGHEGSYEVPVDSAMVLCSYRWSGGGAPITTRIIMLRSSEIDGRAVRVIDPPQRRRSLP